MRIGTWNLEGRWSVHHLDLTRVMDCDVLLLTEVHERVEIPGYDLHLGQQSMAPGRRWAGIAARLPMSAAPDPHGASAMVELAGLRVCASILPWRSCGTGDPWAGDNTAEKTAAAVTAVQDSIPAIWGGDWNHALSGREWSGSLAGRQAVLASVGRLGLHVPTATSPHQIPGLLSIDHIAVPTSWKVRVTTRHRAFAGDTRISDHDAYVVEASEPVGSEGLINWI